MNVQANVLSVILLGNYRQKNERRIIRYLSVQKELETSKEKIHHTFLGMPGIPAVIRSPKTTGPLKNKCLIALIKKHAELSLF